MNPVITFVKDGFKNVLKGLGGDKDARQYTTYQMGLRITQELANNLYTYNWLAAKLIDIPIDDATRKWRNLLISDADDKKEVEEVMNSYDVKGKINLAMKWARVFGGAVIVIIIDGDDPEQPLDIERIRPGSLKNFLVLDRYNIYPSVADRDIMSENYGEPDYYTVVRGGQAIHNSRIIKFNGIIPSIREYEQNNFWGNSNFTRLFEPVSDSQTVSQSINNLVFESNVDVYRIEGLNALVAEGKDNLVVKRLQIAAKMKSIINGIALDKEDEYEKKLANFTNLAEIDDKFIQKVAGAGDIPVTRLMGKSPSGMNATGESDMLNYYDNVSSLQENTIRPKLDVIDQVVLASSFGTKYSKDGTEFTYEFNPLKQLTKIEESDVTLKDAQRDQIYMDYDILNRADVITQLAEDGTYITIDNNRAEEAQKEQEQELEFEPDESKMEQEQSEEQKSEEEQIEQE